MSLEGLKRGAIAVAVAVVIAVAIVNGLVRLTGGGPFILSPLSMPEKIEALLRLAVHFPRHLLGACREDRTELLRRRAVERGLPPEFVWAIARTESNLGPHRISSAGAMGVMQLIPSRARLEGVDDPFDASENIEGGVRFLADLWRRYGGDKTRVAAAYNAGPGRVPRSGRLLELPEETRVYVRRVLEHERSRRRPQRVRSRSTSIPQRSGAVARISAAGRGGALVPVGAI